MFMQQIVTLHLFLPFDLKIYFFFEPAVFNVVWKSYQNIPWGYLQYISLYLKNNIFVFFQMSALRTTLLTVSKTSKSLKILFEDWRLSKDQVVWWVFFCVLCLLTAPVFKNSNFLAKTLSLSKKVLDQTSKGFQYQIWTSVKR